MVQSRDLQDCAGPVARAHPDLPILRRSLESLRVVWLRAVCDEVGADSGVRLPHPKVHCGGIVTSHLHSVTFGRTGMQARRKKALTFLQDADDTEKEIFSSLKAAMLVTTLVKVAPFHG